VEGVGGRPGGGAEAARSTQQRSDRSEVGPRHRGFEPAQRHALLSGRPMTIACPLCRAENAERTCRRCKADLGLLWDVEHQRARLLFDAAEALRRRDCFVAIELAESARELRDDADAAQLIACAHLVRGKFGRALEWHARATASGGR